jgi:NAD(P)-dependent dehydrogenase (short-subunit alcohol dehydrogenase family)
MERRVSKKETAIKVTEAAIEHFDRIDLLVNNAGIFIPKPFTDYTEDDYNLVMSTNVASFFFMTQQVIPQMKKQNSGHVVNISAALADQPSGAVPALLAVLSKSPMPAVSKALALEYAANNIRFNTVSPGNINTPMHAKDNHAALAKFHPLARMGEISDIALKIGARQVVEQHLEPSAKQIFPALLQMTKKLRFVRQQQFVDAVKFMAFGQ